MSDASANDGQERSFDPTPGRIEKARREGDIAVSREVIAAATYAGFYLVLAAGSASLAAELIGGLRRLHQTPTGFAGLIRDHGSAVGGDLFVWVLLVCAPMFLAPAVGAIAAIGGQRGFVLAFSKISPKWNRLSVVGNAKNKFGPHGLGEFSIAAAKLFGVIGIFALSFFGTFAELPAFSLLPAEAAGPVLQAATVLLIGAILLFSTAVAVIDSVRVTAAHKRRLMMTLEEIKRESKESEGDPQLKHMRRERSRAIATNRMLLDVPKANVVIVNPTHFAIALKWDGPKSGAPTLIAKGVDEMAARIREIAVTSGVPIRHDPPTARAIFGAVELGAEIRREHYAAVAAAIHFADAMRAAK